MRLVDKSSVEDEDAADKEMMNKPHSNIRRHESQADINMPIVNK